MSPILALAAALSAATALGAAAAPAAQAPTPKLTLAAAKAVALKARPGAITDSELEKEAGGSGLRYSFDIKSQGVAYEVGVDAMTGKVLENVREGANPD